MNYYVMEINTQMVIDSIFAYYIQFKEQNNKDIDWAAGTEGLMKFHNWLCYKYGDRYFFWVTNLYKKRKNRHKITEDQYEYADSYPSSIMGCYGGDYKRPQYSVCEIPNLLLDVTNLNDSKIESGLRIKWHLESFIQLNQKRKIK
ncbi:TPA: hypothetical protein ACGE2P_004628 [Salmonella enterica subsp. enterica]|uniref:hypothetical protein n=1 Tax=Enterobacter chengduensis TaxID=2494701 RepID=UPI001DC30622|nr:hypothetical protein [Enterobacter chengduensis]EDT7519677.1 hypothetical protein [Salmonella enterica subsp. enterica serovar Uganda]MEC5768559.1 hypothetical protein [Enterobacter chengduensis]HCW0706921.1 hypothetical protein [Klebsiella oxytoca]HCW0736934.1 hypothetical protein [Klebsiella oxytoca]